MAKKKFDPNIGKNTQFGNGQDPTKGGRKKKIYTILKEKGFSKDDIRTCFGEIAFYSTKELEEIREDESKPVIMKVIAGAFINASADGDYRYINQILEQVIGKATQPVDHTTNGESIDPSKFMITKTYSEDDIEQKANDSA